MAEVLTRRRAGSSKSFIICFYVKTNSSQSRERKLRTWWPNGVIGKHLIHGKVSAAVAAFLNSVVSIVLVAGEATFERVMQHCSQTDLLVFLFYLTGFILGNLPKERRYEISKDHVCGGKCMNNARDVSFCNLLLVADWPIPTRLMTPKF